MTAGVHLVAAEDQVAGFRAEQSGIDLIAGPPATAVLLPPGSVPVNAGGEQGIALVVLDAAGNPVAGEPATIALVDAADGTLAPDPSHPGGTQGGPRCSRVAPTAGDTFACAIWPPRPPAAWIRSTRGRRRSRRGDRRDRARDHGGRRHPDRVRAGRRDRDTAFAVIPLRVEAHDSYGNQDPAATPLVRLSADSPTARFSVNGGATWSAPSRLAASRYRVERELDPLARPAAGSFTITASDAAGFLASALHPGVTLHPAPAAERSALRRPDT